MDWMSSLFLKLEAQTADLVRRLNLLAAEPLVAGAGCASPSARTSNWAVRVTAALASHFETPYWS